MARLRAAASVSLVVTLPMLTLADIVATGIRNLLILMVGAFLLVRILVVIVVGILLVAVIGVLLIAVMGLLLLTAVKILLLVLDGGHLSAATRVVMAIVLLAATRVSMAIVLLAPKRVAMVALILVAGGNLRLTGRPGRRVVKGEGRNRDVLPKLLIMVAVVSVVSLLLLLRDDLAVGVMELLKDPAGVEVLGVVMTAKPLVLLADPMLFLTVLVAMLLLLVFFALVVLVVVSVLLLDVPLVAFEPKVPVVPLESAMPTLPTITTTKPTADSAMLTALIIALAVAVIEVSIDLTMAAEPAMTAEPAEPVDRVTPGVGEMVVRASVNLRARSVSTPRWKTCRKKRLDIPQKCSLCHSWPSRTSRPSRAT